MSLRLKKLLEPFIVILVFSSLILQLSIMLRNPANKDVVDAIVRFFSYFTILSNTLVFVYFLNLLLPLNGHVSFWHKPETGTAITVYILVVGIVYHAILSQLHNPLGLAFWADHGLHSFSPILSIVYWILFTSKRTIQYQSIPYWLIYPAVYFVYTIIRGNFSGFYPYPFLDLNKISFLQAFGNSLLVLLVFTFLSLSLSFIANKRSQKIKTYTND